MMHKRFLFLIVITSISLLILGCKKDNTVLNIGVTIGVSETKGSPEITSFFHSFTLDNDFEGEKANIGYDTIYAILKMMPEYANAVDC